jgi:hypothetical protein
MASDCFPPPSSPQVKISEKEKNLKDKMAWTRDQVHLLLKPV